MPEAVGAALDDPRHQSAALKTLERFIDFRFAQFQNRVTVRLLVATSYGAH